MNRPKSNSEKLRVKIAAKGILSIAALAREIGCSRPSIYLALERPTRYSRVFRKIQEVCDE